MPIERASKGVGLLEALIAATAGTVVLGACFLICNQFQEGSSLVQGLLVRTRSVWLVPILVDSWVSSAGSGSDEVLAHDVDAHPASLTARADLTGADGFPDGLLDDSFESVAVDVASRMLRLRSGAGVFQPALPHVGRLAVQQSLPPLLELEFEFEPMAGPGSDSSARKEQLALFLWNRDERLAAWEEDP